MNNLWTVTTEELLPPTPAPIPAWNPTHAKPLVESVEQPQPVVVDLGPGEGQIFLGELIATVLTVLSYVFPVILRWARS